MADTLDTLGTMDRILFLRQVPIFGSLDPGDLQRIAELATEQSYAEGEAIFRDGDEGDEMYVIVRGRVRASKVINGRRQTIREAGPGEHVGELAPLREAPRAVDVTALTDDARMLVIGGGAFKDMLVDRPRVARAMLTNLAERLAAIIEEGAPATRKS